MSDKQFEGAVPRDVWKARVNRRKFLKLGALTGGTIAAGVIARGAGEALTRQVKTPAQAKAEEIFQKTPEKEFKSLRAGKEGANLRNAPSVYAVKIGFLQSGEIVEKAIGVSGDALRITEEEKVAGTWYIFHHPSKEDEMVFSAEENFQEIDLKPNAKK